MPAPLGNMEQTFSGVRLVCLLALLVNCLFVCLLACLLACAVVSLFLLFCFLQFGWHISDTGEPIGPLAGAGPLRASSPGAAGPPAVAGSGGDPRPRPVAGGT